MPDPEQTRRFQFRFSLRQLFFAVALVGVGLGVWTWLFRKVVVIRPATSDDLVSDRYFGFPKEDLKVRNIAVATGTFTRDTSLFVVIFLVQAGKVSDGAGPFNSRNWTSVSFPIWTDLEFQLALGDKDLPSGRATYLGTAGSSKEEGIGRGLGHNFTVVDTQTLPGRITCGRRHIIYVEGDQKINVDGSMTLDDFAKANSGNYLVMMVQVF